MFENLTEKLNQTFKKLTNKGVLSESNIAASLKEVKFALLEADVNWAFLKFAGLSAGGFANANGIQSLVGWSLKLLIGRMNLKKQ